VISEIIETLKRPGLLGLVGSRIEKRARRDLELYFSHLGRKIAALELERAVEHNTKEAARHAVEIGISNTLRLATPLLRSTLEVNIHDALIAANKIHHFAEADDFDNDPLGDFSTLTPGPITSDEASLYASIRAGELVSGINATTQEKIADAIATGIEDNLGVDGTARLIRATLADMTRLRSTTIARTEMNDAFSEATIRKLNRLGVEYKRWILSPDACPICEDNNAQGAIPVDDSFDSGDDRPPAHPNCKCALVGARPPA
jgi:hypothetical protein